MNVDFLPSSIRRLSTVTRHSTISAPTRLAHTGLHPSARVSEPCLSLTSTSVLPNPLLSLLEVCRNIRQMKEVQSQMVVTGLISDRFAASRLVAFCTVSVFPDLDYCSLLLSHIKNPNVYSWNYAIRAYSESDRPQEAVRLYIRMLRAGARPDNHTYPFLFRACGKVPFMQLELGVFGYSIKQGLDLDLFVLNATIHCFTACGQFEYAQKLFDTCHERDLVSWNSLINGYSRGGRPKEGLHLFHMMKDGTVRPDEVTMIGAVSCCGQLGDLSLGKQLHKFTELTNIPMGTRLTNAFIDMYVKCGSLDAATSLFSKMKERTAVSWTSMIVGYLKFGLLEEAKGLFYQMPDKDSVPWNAMIAGLIQWKKEKEAVALFHAMQQSNVKPDEVTMVCLLVACSQTGALNTGLWLHHYINRNFHLNVQLGTALVDMYAKCGNIEKSLLLFQEMPERNAFTWTAMICGLASNGYGEEAISYYKKMIQMGLLPDEITYVGVLSACCHAGLVEDGRLFFAEMQYIQKISPKLKHYSCMVDLLGRAGYLNEAEEMVADMPMRPDSIVLGALFFACRVHGNVCIGERIATQLLELDPSDGGNYVLLANMYTSANMPEKASKIWALMKERQVDKTPGCSSIEVDGIFHEFVVRDKTNPKTTHIEACLMHMTLHMGQVNTINIDDPFEYKFYQI